MDYFKVAVEAYLPEPLTYSDELPDEPTKDFSFENLKLGTSVKVPLGNRTVNGLIVEKIAAQDGEYKLKSIKSLNEERPSLDSTFLAWAKWISKYYQWPLGLVLGQSFPPLKKTTSRKSTRASVIPFVEPTPPKTLTSEQEASYKSITQQTGFHNNLIFGVTGSGKTEIYLRLLEDVLARNQRGIVLVPEISLTPQLINRFSARFPDQIAVIHSALTPREKTDQWWSIVEGDKKILIGARSALFCPLPNLGLIVVDEEHEASFKQDTKFKYNGRDAAIMLAKFKNCPIVLGSATPSLETWNNTLEGKCKLHTLKARVEDRAMPNIKIVDIKDSREANKNSELPFWMSEELFEGIKNALENNNQSALFLNRRGMAQSVLCESCGFVLECPNCSISLTLHNNKYLSCHYCDYGDVLKEECPSCKQPTIKPLGMGTELVETDIQKLFPEARVGRADRDEIRTRLDLEDLITKMEANEIDILIGTQMIAKGLDFPHLTFVGLVLADVSFNIPDFRSAERSFQLLTQVSGRSGRHIQDGGEVVIQTYNPNYPSLIYAKNNDFSSFAEQELQNRKELLYPPFGKLASLKIISSHQSRAENTANRLTQRAQTLKSKYPEYEPLMILGPAQAPLFKLQNKYRYHLLLKSPTSQLLSQFSKQLLIDQKWVDSATKVQIDIDPINML